MINSVFGSPWIERKRKIFVLESRNANERPEGLEKKIGRNAFVGSSSFLCIGEMIWITVHAWTVMISVCLRITEMKREIFVLESRNANERPEGFGKENSKDCFCRILLIFMQRGK